MFTQNIWLDVNVYSGFTYNHPKLDITHMSVNWWMDKQIAPQSYNTILFDNIEKQTTDKCNNTDESQMHYAKWKKTRRYILYDSIYMIL